MSGFYVGQKVVVIEDHVGEYGSEIKYKVGDILFVSSVDGDGDPSFVGEKLSAGWSNHDWFTPIDTDEPKIEITQIRIYGQLYNLVPVENS